MRYRVETEYMYISKTCKKRFDREMPLYGDKYNIYVEFWEGRKFIGALCGEEYTNDEIYIDRFFVTKKLRNKGYGKQILNCIAKKYKYNYVESTIESVGFYRKCGFIKKRNQNNCIYGDTIDMYRINRKKRI